MPTCEDQIRKSYTPYLEGVAAREAGSDELDNPYPVGTPQRWAWNCGWYASQEPADVSDSWVAAQVA